MEWEEVVFPDQEDWEKQYNVTAYYGNHKIASLIYSTEYGWESVINGNIECLYDAETEEDAKRDFKDRLEIFLEGEIDYYKELCSMLKELTDF